MVFLWFLVIFRPGLRKPKLFSVHKKHGFPMVFGYFSSKSTKTETFFIQIYKNHGFPMVLGYFSGPGRAGRFRPGRPGRPGRPQGPLPANPAEPAFSHITLISEKRFFGRLNFQIFGAPKPGPAMATLAALAAPAALKAAMAKEPQAPVVPHGLASQRLDPASWRTARQSLRPDPHAPRSRRGLEVVIEVLIQVEIEAVIEVVIAAC